jgi:hypothetical protein
MADYAKQLQRIVREYRQDGQEWPASTKEIARWVIRTHRYDLRAPAIEKILARDMRKPCVKSTSPTRGAGAFVRSIRQR